MEYDAVQQVAVTVPAATVAASLPTAMRSDGVELTLDPHGHAAGEGHRFAGAWVGRFVGGRAHVEIQPASASSCLVEVAIDQTSGVLRWSARRRSAVAG